MVYFIRLEEQVGVEAINKGMMPVVFGNNSMAFGRRIRFSVIRISINIMFFHAHCEGETLACLCVYVGIWAIYLTLSPRQATRQESTYNLI